MASAPFYPYADVDSSLRSLACAAEGFGAEASGGKEGPVFSITTLNGEGPGSLREACSSDEPLWITFSVSGDIVLSEPILVKSNKTIDGRGQRVALRGNGLHLYECENVIVCNLIIEEGRGEGVDAIRMKPNVKNVWIDRCSLADFDDGLLDVTRGSTNVTVSRCHFRQHNKTMLIGADPTHVEDRNTLVTVHGCFFDGTRQRHPRVRFAKVHLYNNFTRYWALYAVCASVESEILSQCNVYEAGDEKKTFEFYAEQAADAEAEATGQLRSQDDLFVNNALGETKDEAFSFDPHQTCSRQFTIALPSIELAAGIMQRAGWQEVPLPEDV